MAARSSAKTLSKAIEPPAATPSSGYLVVARRYRPQTFEELVGQEHVATALKNAIKSGRVGHAYLFTGARGVGKTSTARIFAKALNCVKGPTVQPCNECDICRSISTGEDIDVLEIDGASNRGIEEIRQLRQNVVVRPSRSRYKIYIIDEVHMLTKEAFNALLKTLEEPPEHVKFIFCTTEPNKVPVTILSRCQRFDFAGIDSRSIISRLQQILDAEKVKAEPGVLELLAQRAAGSMRDAQSLLEQLLAFSDREIKLQDVFDLLGMTQSDVLEVVVQAAGDGDARKVLETFHLAVQEGADPALFIEQLLVLLRDCLVAEVGAGPELFLSAKAEQKDRIARLAQQWGLPRLLAGMQILDHALFRMRAVTYDRVLAELALLRLARLGDLAYVGVLLEQLRSGEGSPSPGIAKANSAADFASIASRLPPAPSSPASFPSQSSGTKNTSSSDREGIAPKLQDPIAAAKAEIQAHRASPPAGRPGPISGSRSSRGASPGWSQENVAAIWKQVCERVGGLAADHARAYHTLMVVGDSKLVVVFRKDKEFSKNYCTQPATKERFAKALAELVGREIDVDFVVSSDGSDEAGTGVGTPGDRTLFDILQEPIIRKTVEIFGARPVAVLPPSKKPIEQPAAEPPPQDSEVFEETGEESGEL